MHMMIGVKCLLIIFFGSILDYDLDVTPDFDEMFSLVKNNYGIQPIGNRLQPLKLGHRRLSCISNEPQSIGSWKSIGSRSTNDWRKHNLCTLRSQRTQIKMDFFRNFQWRNTLFVRVNWYRAAPPAVHVNLHSFSVISGRKTADVIKMGSVLRLR